MARKINNVYVRIAQTFRAWERRYPNQPHRLRVAAFDRIADGFLAVEHVNDNTVRLIEGHARSQA